MTIGDEKVVSWQWRRMAAGGYWGPWIDCESKEAADKLILSFEHSPDRIETRALIPQSAYAELAAELEVEIQEVLRLHAKCQAAESQLAELRGKLEGLAAKWEEGTENRENETGYVRGVDFTFAKCANELHTLAAADGGGHGG